MAGRGLTPKQAEFVREYLVDLNATQAAIRAKYSPKTAQEQSSRLLSNVIVANAIQAAMAERAAKTEITQDMVLQRWWDIASADPNALVQYRRTCCRRCHGKKHAHQWRDPEEFAEALTAAEKVQASELPSDAGGYGYDRKADPHPNCPECFGEGIPEIHALDTRKLTGAAKLLYAGAKVSKEGFEIKLQDQARALENVAKHLGMFKADQVMSASVTLIIDMGD